MPTITVNCFFLTTYACRSLMKINPLRAVALLTAAASLLVAGRPSAARTSLISAADSVVSLARDAQGRSGALRTRMVMPGERFSLPLEWKGDRASGLEYQWLSAGDTLTGAADPIKPLTATTTMVEAPARAGVYRLQLSANGATHFVPGFQLVVKVPLPEKSSELNGYRIGKYPASARGRTDRYGLPKGLIEV